MKLEKGTIADTIHQYFSNEKRSHALIIAHRGGAKSFRKTENTLEIFVDAIDNNVKMIEFDVRRTLDNELIVFHDPKIDGQKIQYLTYKQLNELTGFPVPKFEEALELCSNKIMLDIELKEPGYEKEALSIIKKYYTHEHFIITSFHDKVVKTIKELNPDIYVGLLLGRGDFTPSILLSELFPLRRLKKSNADFVVPNYKLVTPWLVHACRRHKYHIYVWTVNGDGVYAKLIRNKVTGIITDYPQRYTGDYSNK